MDLEEFQKAKKIIQRGRYYKAQIDLLESQKGIPCYSLWEDNDGLSTELIDEFRLKVLAYFKEQERGEKIKLESI